jgi:hypothetical protein
MSEGNSLMNLSSRHVQVVCADGVRNRIRCHVLRSITSHRKHVLGVNLHGVVPQLGLGHRLCAWQAVSLWEGSVRVWRGGVGWAVWMLLGHSQCVCVCVSGLVRDSVWVSETVWGSAEWWSCSSRTHKGAMFLASSVKHDHGEMGNKGNLQ